MIKNDTVKILINKGNKGFFKKIKNDLVIGEYLIIPINFLSKNSKIKVEVQCDVCGAEHEILYCNYIKNVSNGDIYTCNKCSNIKANITNLKKYNTTNPNLTEEIRNKRIQASLERYGTENPSQNEKVKEKRKKTNLEIYGNECSLLNYEVKNKTKNTLFEKYDCDNFSKTKEFKEKVINTSLEKYGVTSYSKTNESKSKTIETNNTKYNVSHPSKREIHKELFKVNLKEYQLKRKNDFLNKHSDIGLISIDKNICNCVCKICNSSYNIPLDLFKNRIRIKTNPCTICNPINSGSGLQSELFQFIKSVYNNKQIIQNIRTVLDNKYELDIYIPSEKIAFEFNGLYWHCELNKEKYYHKSKSDYCHEKNIQLIHVWEDDWIYKQNIIKSIILNKLGLVNNKIYARKCVIKDVSVLDTKSFLNENHIQGFTQSSIRIGLYYNDELVSIMTFGKNRKITNENKKQDFELLRFCSKTNTNVVGGASKLFAHFIKNTTFKKIISYADRSHSNGSIYNKLGFSFVKITEPNYYYIVDGIRYHRFNYRKDILIKAGFNKNKTEHEIMLDRGYYRIYNSGNLKFEYINKKVQQ